MDEKKAVIASNLIRLRLAAGITQAELGEKLNYSDKTISKWERGDVTTDVFVLMDIAAVFDVSVDYLLSVHGERDPVIYNQPKPYNTRVITAIATLGVWALALALFVAFWLAGYILWQILLFALPISLITLLVMQSVFHQGRGNRFIVAALAISVITAFYLLFLNDNPWQLFLLLVPTIAIVFLAFRVKK